ncbi:TSUP family transporter [Sediminibacterium roseum]|uniref:Probable membrane transporter protein n=1 Tax=Sediminibacterium roseum TaxID=1978412 RepID=A0ABW9ZVL1_9BACT|nr:TSUP family transporter [Sediminibacterium roseum]NCI50407.1 TSUP family transporter [Sediminibacterium roseum]
MTTFTLVLLCVFAFSAGFVDAIVGGGGLIQTPASLVLLPQLPVATVIGSLKIPAFTGTAFATVQYLKKVKVRWKMAIAMCLVACSAAFLGAEVLTLVNNRFMKPVIFIVLLFVAIYTYTKKNFGQHTHKTHSAKTEMFYAILIAVCIGFYDGFIGPGAGSFLVLAFISLLGFDFLHASANAKLVNLSTNFGSILLFLLKGTIIWKIALPMAACNGLGGALGARLAISKGNRFIRVFFLLIITATLVRFGYDAIFQLIISN